MTTRVIDLLTDPSPKNYREAFRDLLRRKYLGDDVDTVLYNLDYVYHVAANYAYYAALYGHRRVLAEIFRVIGRLSVQSRLVVLADAYRYDRTILDDLYDELISFKRSLIREGAPPELVSIVNAILSSTGAKPDDLYRQIKHLVAMYDTWKELGDDALEYLRMQLPGAPSQSSPTDTELAKVVLFVLDAVASRNRVSSADIKRYIGNPQLANQLINAAKKRHLLQYNSVVRSWVPTREGLEFVGRASEYDPDELVNNLKGV